MAHPRRGRSLAAMRPWHFAGLLLSTAATVQAFSSVSITVNWPHECAATCLYEGYGLEDIGSVLGCGLPYNNDCYCATNTRAASLATSYLPVCASSHCASGDEADDLSAIESIYASYCMAAGYTQPGMTAWLSPNPAEATTAAAGESLTAPASSTTAAEPGTTTQVSYVTQTTTSQPSDAGSTNPQVTVHLTSTTYVSSSTSTVAASSPSGGTNAIALGAGLGVGIPIALALVGIGLWFCLRQRRRPSDVDAQPPDPVHASPPVDGVVPPPLGPHEMARAPRPQSQIFRKPVGNALVAGVATGAVSPISGSPSPGFGRGSELTGQDTRTEMSGEGRPPELAGMHVPGSPPPAYYTQLQLQHHQEGWRDQGYPQQGDRRWELA